MRARDQLNGVEAGAIEGFGHRQHHAGRHVLGPEALVAVANSSVDETNAVSGHGALLPQTWSTGVMEYRGSEFRPIIPTLKCSIFPCFFSKASGQKTSQRCRA